MNKETENLSTADSAQCLLKNKHREAPLLPPETMTAMLQQLGGATRFWETVVEMLSDAVFLVGPDRKILYWNHAAERLTGYERGDVIGSHCQDAVHCKVCEHRCGVFDVGELHDIPLVLRSRDGSVLEVVKNAAVVRDALGQPVLGVEVLRDMTAWNERERASGDARRSAEQQKLLLRNVLDSVTEGIVGVSRELRVRFVSASAEVALGVSEDEAVGYEVGQLAGPEIAAMAKHVIQSGASVSRARLEVPIATGIQVPLSVTISPLQLPGQPDGAMLLVRDLREEERRQRERMRSQGFAFGTLVSRSPRMQEVFDLVDQVAPTSATILLQGDSGTGKELVAREIHKRSRRAAGPFHAVNCAAIAAEILESEFFGHERGAFTGAVNQKRGRFEIAHTGTIFLDEVGELPLELQAKLLRVLEERSFERVGGTKPIQVDVRVIAATNRDLRKMVDQGSFREDLFYRLRVVPVRLPTLVERMEDVELLADHFLRRLGEREGKEPLRMGHEALRMLLDYPWPGNVRELANAMEYAAVVARGPVVQPGDLPRELRLPRLNSSRADAPATSVGPAQADVPGPDTGREATLIGDERARIRASLEASKYQHGDAAKLLGMHRTTLYRKRLRYGI